MVNAVIDTNVLMAALIKKDGPNRLVLRKILDPVSPFKICYSSQIMDEYADVFARQPVVSRGLGGEAAALIELIADVADQIIPKYIPALVYPDIYDRPFVEAAVYANAILLTNNLRDYPFVGLNAITPEDFLAWCNAHGY